MQLGEIGIAQIQFNLRSRDDIPKVLRGLQHLYLNEALREQVFTLLENEMAPGVDKHNGHPGMDLWRILVCGVLRLDLNIDYDRLLELVNEHKTLRKMLGHGLFDADLQYNHQTLIDNVELFTPELLDKLNQIIVVGGHVLLKKGDIALRGWCDSFVVETNVLHFWPDYWLHSFCIMHKNISLVMRSLFPQSFFHWLRQIL